MSKRLPNAVIIYGALALGNRVTDDKGLTWVMCDDGDLAVVADRLGEEVYIRTFNGFNDFWAWAEAQPESVIVSVIGAKCLAEAV